MAAVAVESAPVENVVAKTKKVTVSFEDRLTALTSFVQEKSKFPSKSKDDSSENALQRFVYTSKKKFKDGKLSADQVSALEALPNWSWETKAKATKAAPVEGEEVKEKPKRKRAAKAAPVEGAEGATEKVKKPRAKKAKKDETVAVAEQ